MAIGPGAVASNTNAIAMGNGATASGVNSIALGANSSASAPNSVALGVNSVATQANSVSVGSGVANGTDPGTRTITNVTAGVNDTDAVNVSQLKNLGNNILNQAKSYADGIGRKAYGGVASVMAMGEAPYIPGKLTAYEGVGYFQGQVAVGVSMRRTSHNGRWSIIGGASYSKDGGVAARIGATQVFDIGD